MKSHAFLEELKRRHVWRVAVAYAVAGWLLVQVATQVFPFFDIPNWGVRLIVILVAIGFAVSVAFAWIYELTPEGIRRTETVDSPETPAEPEHRQIGRRLNAFIVAVLVLAVALLGWRLATVHHETDTASSATPTDETRAVPLPAPVSSAAAATPASRPLAGAEPPPSPKSIAVLPFENLSADKGNAYFADGMQDLILTKLADIGDLKVISRTSTEKYKSHPDDLKTIGHQLGVATILEGSVQKAGNEVLINVQLIDAGTDSHLWAQSYQRTLDNIFGVEGEVAGKVADALSARLTAAEAASLTAVPTRDQAALDLFLKAEYQSLRGLANLDFDHWRAAVSLYRQAIAHDPAFALAYARMSYAESLMVWFGAGIVDAASLKHDAREDAARALALAPGLAAAQIAVGYSDHFGRRDEAAAAKAFETALSLKPNDPDALAGLGLVEFEQGHVRSSVDLFQRAFALDPRSATRATQAGAACAWVFRYDDAERLFQRALALDPHEGLAKALLVWTIVYGSGDIPRALTVASDKYQQVHLLTLQRKYQAALTLSDSLSPGDFADASGDSRALLQAELYRLLDDTAKARPLFEQALALARAQSDKHPDAPPKLKARLESHVAAAELGLGHTKQALDAIARMRAEAARSGDRGYEQELMKTAAQLYAEARRPDLAIPLLAEALATPGIGLWYSPVMLRIDPYWDPIRNDPHFQRLLERYAKAEATTTLASP